jgi:hypothetical protein
LFSTRRFNFNGNQVSSLAHQRSRSLRAVVLLNARDAFAYTHRIASVLTLRRASVAIANVLADAPNLSAAHGKIVRLIST